MLDDVSLSILKGSSVGMLGRSSLGNSTLLRVLSCLMPGTSGDVYWRDLGFRSMRSIPMVFQSFVSFYSWLFLRTSRGRD